MQSANLKDLIKQTTNLKVLYVEDDEETRTHTLKMLHNFFSNISIGMNGNDGLKNFKNDNFDVIFTDINMPGVDGMELIQGIRRVNVDIPIIILSAHEKREYFLNSIKYGVDGYLLKPFGYEELEEVIIKILKIIKNDNIISLSDGFYWDVRDKTLYRGGARIKLTKNELTLFRLLASNSNAVRSPIEIEAYVFDDDLSDATRVRNLLSRLKKKVQCELVESIYAEGYRLKR